MCVSAAVPRQGGGNSLSSAILTRTSASVLHNRYDPAGLVFSYLQVRRLSLCQYVCGPAAPPNLDGPAGCHSFMKEGQGYPAAGRADGQSSQRQTSPEPKCMSKPAHRAGYDIATFIAVSGFGHIVSYLKLRFGTAEVQSAAVISLMCKLCCNCRARNRGKLQVRDRSPWISDCKPLSADKFRGHLLLHLDRQS